MSGYNEGACDYGRINTKDLALQALKLEEGMWTFMAKLTKLQ